MLAVIFALFVTPSGAKAQPQWPECLEHRVVFRHNHAYGIFVDLGRLVGAKEGCWQDNCAKTDKFICPSVAECAAACARVDACRFWTYEPGIVKCFLRSSDAGRETHSDFVSGARACRPQDGNAATATLPSVARVTAPFAAAAIWAAELPAFRACEGGVGAPGCDNPYGAMGVLRYAVNNLRAVVSRLPQAAKAQHQSTLLYVQQIAMDVAAFYQQPTPEAFKVAYDNSKMVFDALKGWLQGSPASELELKGENSGAPHLPGGRSAVLPREGGGAVKAAVAQLANGREMPLVGFGTWQLVGQATYDAIIAAVRAGYRHIDTAQAYMNEREVGIAIRDCGVPRHALFIATKISDPEDYPRAAERFEAQLAALGLEYLDLYMLHTAGDRSDRETAWRAMELLHDQGKVRALGVSNFGISELEELWSFARVKPVYVQNKFSIYSPGEQQVGPTSVLPYARERGIQVMGYSVINPWPFLLPPMQDPHVLAVAARYGKTAAQVLHRWALQLGVAVIPKSATAARIEENAKLFDFELSEVDMRILNGLVCLSEAMLGAPPTPSWGDDVYGIGSLTDLA
mmetsp:Transcript_93785/g.264899  ORF Transcript_93785/g.264899 Transcript_93785/m.264899 type:complete len:572 (-) Transcript_93785:219-1934(-)